MLVNTGRVAPGTHGKTFARPPSPSLSFVYGFGVREAQSGGAIQGASRENVCRRCQLLRVFYRRF